MPNLLSNLDCFRQGIFNFGRSVYDDASRIRGMAGMASSLTRGGYGAAGGAVLGGAGGYMASDDHPILGTLSGALLGAGAGAAGGLLSARNGRRMGRAAWGRAWNAAKSGTSVG